MSECVPSIPPIWVISLKRAAARREFVTRHFETVALPFEFVDGVDGNELTADETERYSRRGALIEIGRPLTRGELGCSLSHLYLYERMIREDVPIAVIMEDDVDPTAALEPALRDLAKVPDDWDVVTFHSLFDLSEPYIVGAPEVAGGYRVCRYRRKVFGTQCYVITQAAARRALRAATPVRLPHDELLFRRHPAKLNIYGLEPKVVREGSFESELVGRPGVVGGSVTTEDALTFGDRAIVVAGKAWRRWRDRASHGDRAER